MEGVSTNTGSGAKYVWRLAETHFAAGLLSDLRTICASETIILLAPSSEISYGILLTATHTFVADGEGFTIAICI